MFRNINNNNKFNSYEISSLKRTSVWIVNRENPVNPIEPVSAWSCIITIRRRFDGNLVFEKLRGILDTLVYYGRRKRGPNKRKPIRALKHYWIDSAVCLALSRSPSVGPNVFVWIVGTRKPHVSFDAHTRKPCQLCAYSRSESDFHSKEPPESLDACK